MNKYNFSKYAMISLDIFSFCLSFVLALLMISSVADLEQYIPYDEIGQRSLIHLGLSSFCVGWFWIRLRHYTYRKPFWFELKEILRTLFIFSIIDLAILSLSKLYVSRYVWLCTWSIIVLLFPLGRICLKRFLIKIGWFLKDTVIIGGKKNAIDAYNAINDEPYLGLNVKFFISENRGKELKSLNKKILTYRNLNQYWDEFSLDTQFILALEDDENHKRDTWVRNLIKREYRHISIIPTLRGLPLYSTDMSFLFSYEMILLRINHNLAKRSSRLIKRFIDIVLSSILLLILSPLLCSIWLLLQLSGGNALYGHTRIGENSQPFQCWKFRTMRKDADKFLEIFLKENPKAHNEWKETRKLKNDPRITRIGRFLRSTSLDELPQLFNVLSGDMSLVGPRPVTQEELEYYHSSLDYYFMAKPGITGLWQVSGRSNVSYETRVYFDSWYVKNWSIWNDFVILCKTVPVVLKRTGSI